MRALFVVAAAMFFGGCSTEAGRAKDELTFLEEHEGTPRQICDAARRLTAATSKAGNEAGFRSAQTTEWSRCSTMDTFPQYADIPGGMPKASDAEIDNALAESSTR